MSRALTVVAVVVGGAIGTGLRMAVDAAVPPPPTGVPLSTLAINIVGSFALGLLVVALWPRVPVWTRAGLGAGVMGGFTSFSAIVVGLVTAAEPGAGGLVPSLSFFVGAIAAPILAAAAGLALGARLGSGARRSAASRSSIPDEPDVTE